MFADWEQAAASTAAHLHALLAAEPGDPDVAVLIDVLLAESPEFASLWPRYEVRHRRGSVKPFNHPRVGSFTLTYEVLHLDEGQRITVYQAEPGTRDHDAVTLLSMMASGAGAATGRTGNE